MGKNRRCENCFCSLFIVFLSEVYVMFCPYRWQHVYYSPLSVLQRFGEQVRLHEMKIRVWFGDGRKWRNSSVLLTELWNTKKKITRIPTPPPPHNCKIAWQFPLLSFTWELRCSELTGQSGNRYCEVSREALEGRDHCAPITPGSTAVKPPGSPARGAGSAHPFEETQASLLVPLVTAWNGVN